MMYTDSDVNVKVLHIDAYGTRWLKKRKENNLRRPELGRLAHQFLESWVYVFSEFVEMKQFMINSIEYAMSNMHINYPYSE